MLEIYNLLRSVTCQPVCSMTSKTPQRSCERPPEHLLDEPSDTETSKRRSKPTQRSLQHWFDPHHCSTTDEADVGTWHNQLHHFCARPSGNRRRHEKRRSKHTHRSLQTGLALIAATAEEPERHPIPIARKNPNPIDTLVGAHV